MNWEAIGAIGEIIGALAVFITLIYLASQIRQNTRAVHSAALDSTVNTISTARQSIHENHDVSEVYLKGLSSPEELTELEQLRFRLLLHNMLLSESNKFAQAKFSDLPISEWEAQQNVLKRVIGSPGGQWFWGAFSSEFDRKFKEEIDRIMK